MVLTLRTAPSPAFASNTALCPIIAFSASSLDIDTYSWSFGDGGVSSQSGPSHTYTANGTYTVSLVAANACGVDSSSQTLVISCIVGTLEGNLQSATLYPNPSKGDFTLQAQLGVADALSYSVVDLSGRTLMAVQHDQAQSSWQEQIRLAVPSGMYFLHLVSGDAKATLLVVVE
jgi:PKD repeat protein